MPEGQVLEFSGITKRFGAVTAVDGFTARVEPGRVTGFLGPNGAGKTTTLRMLLGLVRPSAGTATIGGLAYASLAHPLQSVGAVLEASSFHPGRTAADHLRVYAQAAGLAGARVDEALGLVGLADVAGRKVGGYSLGMRQRLGLAYALLGDPGVLVLDEPANGLDPEGIKWMRGLLRDLARQGRTVFVSSHLLSEVQQTVDALIVISAGRVVFQGDLDELTDPSDYVTVVDSDDRERLANALRAAAVDFELLRSGLTVRGLDTASVGRIAAGAGIALTTLHRRGPALEEVFLDLVNGVRVHPSAAGFPVVPGPPTPGTPADAERADVEQPADADPVDPAADHEPAVVPADADPADAGVEDAEAEEAEPKDVTPDEPTETSDRAAAFAVASTGVIDIIPATEREEGDEADADTEPADPEESGAPGEPADVDRPWERYEKTDADLEADRFFAAFDDSADRDADDRAPGQAEPAEPEAPAVALANDLETPDPDEIGPPPPEWHAQPEPLPAEDDDEAAEGSEDEDAADVTEGGERR